MTRAGDDAERSDEGERRDGEKRHEMTEMSTEMSPV